MVTNMLKAISKMLSTDMNFCRNDKATGGVNVEITAFRERVNCAKTMLDEVIKGLDGGGPKTIVGKVGMDKLCDPTPLEPTPKKEQEYMISVDDQKCLKLIKGLPLATEVELDKKRMTHREAIGQKFQKIRILL